VKASIDAEVMLHEKRRTKLHIKSMESNKESFQPLVTNNQNVAN